MVCGDSSTCGIDVSGGVLECVKHLKSGCFISTQLACDFKYSRHKRTCGCRIKFGACCGFHSCGHGFVFVYGSPHFQTPFAARLGVHLYVDTLTGEPAHPEK